MEVESGPGDAGLAGGPRVVHVEVQLLASSRASASAVRDRVLDLLSARFTGRDLLPGALPLSESGLEADVARAVVDLDEPWPSFLAQPEVHVFRLHTGEAYEETSEEDPRSTVFTHWDLPSAHFEGLWESLLFEEGVKAHLLEFAASSLLFSRARVDPHVISWNHVVLLYGPPGTGKTSLCQALAHKLSVRLGAFFRTARLLEINSHSLFSKWFSESGKLVSQLFQEVHALAEDESSLVMILIDEVESLAAARSAAVSGSEPSDSIRVVNALLTQIDKLKTRKNVMVLTTSNITEAIDLAFVDRADIRQYVGLPNQQVRRRVLETCVDEVVRAGLALAGGAEERARLLDDVARACEGMSGRALRKLPFQAHARFVRRSCVPLAHFLRAMLQAAHAERQSCDYMARAAADARRGGHHNDSNSSSSNRGSSSSSNSNNNCSNTSSNTSSSTT